MHDAFGGKEKTSYHRTLKLLMKTSDFWLKREKRSITSLVTGGKLLASIQISSLYMVGPKMMIG